VNYSSTFPPCGLHAEIAFLGRQTPLSEEGEGSTELVEYSHAAESSQDCQVYMASLCNADDDEPGPKYPRQARPAQAERGKPRMQPYAPKDPQQRFRSSR
jgi:hypothetical protein